MRVKHEELGVGTVKGLLDDKLKVVFDDYPYFFKGDSHYMRPEELEEIKEENKRENQPNHSKQL